MGFVQYFAGLIEQRRGALGDDVLSGLIVAEEDGESLSMAELFAMLILLFIAGHETTTNLIGNGTLALLRSSDQFGLLRAPRPISPPAPPRSCSATTRPSSSRLAPPSRRPTSCGMPIRAGQTVVCGLAAGNRDPRFVADPELLRIDREPPMHLSFSNGMHHCLGAPLARLEGQIAFVALAQRFPDMALVTDDPPYRDHFILRGLSALPVAL